MYNTKKIATIATGAVLLISLLFIGQASAGVIDYQERYQDYQGTWYKYINENIAQHPLYFVTDNGNYYTISRHGTTVNIPKRTWINYNFYSDRIQPVITIQNYSQIDQLATKVNSSVWYLTVPWSASHVKSVTDDLIDMGVFKRTTSLTVLDSSIPSKNYQAVPKIIGDDIRLYFNPAAYSGVVYPLTLTENTITVDNATTSGFTSANVSFDDVRWTDSGYIAIHLRNDSQLNMTGLVGYWSMDESTGTLVHQVNTESGLVNITNQGTWNGNATVNYTNGVIGNALAFDGVNDYVDAGNNASLNLTNTITISVWVKLNNVTPRQSIIGKAPLAATGSGYAIYIEGGTFRFWVYNSTGNRVIKDYGTLTNNMWYSAISIINNTHITNYLNGVLINTQAINGFDGNYSYGLKFGAYSSTNTYNLNGSIDEVRIYNRALSASEITVMYNTSLRTRGNITILNQSASADNVINRTRIVYSGQDAINNISIYARQNGTTTWSLVQNNATSNAWYSIINQYQSNDFRIQLNGNGSNTPFFTSLEWDETPLPISNVSNQSFWDYENASIVFNVSNADYCEGHLNGSMIISCIFPHSYGFLTSGNYLYSINSTNTTGYLWSNTSAIIIIYDNFDTQWNSYTNDANITFNNTPVNMMITYRIDLLNETNVTYVWYKDGIAVNGTAKTNMIVLDVLGWHNITVYATMNSVTWSATWTIGVLDGWAAILTKMSELETKIDNLPTQDDVGAAGTMGLLGGIIGGVFVVSFIKRYWRK